ncbi:mechanosensitive ion channel protein MscS [Aliidiomarina taiwanensis]|uniref:Mechanosensitive ion channel protein MscS n=1 Tax=Aliidiomarina taiwanensis TaxID=946228 RepID=A0A432X8X0_9GAMM|nr:mechanosensitive ion channel family protein [Aliidiomarina taiwanensis]RUO43770.1 mechanosensitive ion channel protein MscS [Aliidiomarina taiwanensis]
MQTFIDFWQQTLAWLDQYPRVEAAAGVAVLLIIAGISNNLVKRVLVRVFVSTLKRIVRDDEKLDLHSNVVARLANIVPALVLSIGVTFVPHLPEAVVTVVKNVAGAFIILTIALAINAFLTLLNRSYERRPDANRKPIKGYLQIVTIVVYVIAAILIIATLIDKSPLILLSGLGAMAAVLMLVFQDTLLSLVASMQITSGDLIRVGDWVEMPDANADGDVIDLALHTVKIQNWDKTITSVPTRRFITTGFKNWRGMQESGGRRMVRSMMLDQQSIGFLSEEQLEKLKRFSVLEEYLNEKLEDISSWNQDLEKSGKDKVNSRWVTNIGTFRAYVQRYLENHPGISQDMTLLVRQRDPTSEGLPLQIYAFTNTTAWAEYEGIQSDIFDHLYAIVPEFGLRVFQKPSGRDVTDYIKSYALPDPQH